MDASGFCKGKILGLKKGKNLKSGMHLVSYSYFELVQFQDESQKMKIKMSDDKTG